MHASAFRDQSFADVDGGTFARVAGVGLEGEAENGYYFAIKRVEQFGNDALGGASEQEEARVESACRERERGGGVPLGEAQLLGVVHADDAHPKLCDFGQPQALAYVDLQGRGGGGAR
jgi:hypothetical protein